MNSAHSCPHVYREKLGLEENPKIGSRNRSDEGRELRALLMVGMLQASAASGDACGER